MRAGLQPMISKYDGFSRCRVTPPLNDSMNSLSVGFPGRENESAILFQHPYVCFPSVNSGLLSR